MSEVTGSPEEIPPGRADGEMAGADAAHRAPRQRVTGVGGVFWKSADPSALASWYSTHLGVPLDATNVGIFRWREVEPDGPATTVVSPFPADTDYFAPSPAPFMFNFRVRDLDAMLRQLRLDGCTVMDQLHESEFGRFGWVIDPEGVKVELWEPPPGE